MPEASCIFLGPGIQMRSQVWRESLFTEPWEPDTLSTRVISFHPDSSPLGVRGLIRSRGWPCYRVDFDPHLSGSQTCFIPWTLPSLPRARKSQKIEAGPRTEVQIPCTVFMPTVNHLSPGCIFGVQGQLAVRIF